jgi:flagellar P-ring protein precursor FlgI
MATPIRSFITKGDCPRRRSGIATSPSWWLQPGLLLGVLSGVLLSLLLSFPLPATAAPASAAAAADSARLKDLGRFAGWRDNMLVGYGLVTGLAGTGDSPRSRATRQSLANLLTQFDLVLPQDQLQSRNVAVVMITATLPAFARTGDRLDISVTSAGDARSLVGGILMMTPLKGPDGRSYALAQGALSVGGYKYDLNGNVVQKNHPTTGMVPNGASVEVAVGSQLLHEGGVDFLLTDPDLTTASRVALAVNSSLGSGLASALDPGTVRIQVPTASRDHLVPFLTRIESIAVQPDKKARVVVNERTGTVVAGADVTLSRVTITHGDLRVSVVTDYLVSQPPFLIDGGPGVRTQVVPQTRINVNEAPVEAVRLGVGSTVADLVQALNRIKATPRDVISILQGIKAAGALRAELIIQ